MNDTGAAAAFLASRACILKHRTDYDAAVREFRWPRQERFNWALDYFDVVATGNDSHALHLVEEDGTETIRSFAELSAASNRVANFLYDLGARRGDCLMLMLGNEVALWETLLAAIKLGLVVTPATPLLTAADLQDRIDRGRVRHVVTGSPHVSKFARVTGAFTKVAVGDGAPGWQSYDATRDADATFTAIDATHAADPMLLYFTSGTTATPKLVVLEATGGYESVVAGAIVGRGIDVAVVNPRLVRDFTKATGVLAKTDRIDARVLARFAEAVRPEPRPVPTAEVKELDEYLSRRR